MSRKKDGPTPYNFVVGISSHVDENDLYLMYKYQAKAWLEFRSRWHFFKPPGTVCYLGCWLACMCKTHLSKV